MTTSTRVALTRIPDSWGWMAPDLLRRLLPFAVVVAVVEIGWRPAWLGFSTGRPSAQIIFAAVAAPILFIAAAAVQLLLARRRGVLSVPSGGGDAWFQAAFYVLNGPIEEAFFRGLVQGGLGLAFGVPVGFIAGTATYVLYHRLGWPWAETLATALVGIPLGLAVVLTAFDGSVLVLALPAIASEFHARVPALSNLGSVLALGALGALPLATLADRFGRRRLIAIGVGGFSIANFASAFAPSLEALAVLRLIAVCFEVLVAGVATALIVEEAPPGRRGQAVSVLAVLSGIGTGLTVLAYPVVAPHWRWLFLAGGIGLVAAPLIWRRLPEGRAWQRVRRSGSALRLLFGGPWRRRLVVIAATTALLAVLLEPAGLLFTLFASQVLRLSPVAISELIVASGLAGVAS